MTEEVEIEGSNRFFADFPHCRTYFIQVLQCAGERSESSSSADPECQRYRIGAGHWRLNNRRFDFKQIKNPLIWPLPHAHPPVIKLIPSESKCAISPA